MQFAGKLTPDQRVFMLDWNETNEALGRALTRLGNGLGELHFLEVRDLAYDDDVVWHAFYLLENATVDLGLE